MVARGHVEGFRLGRLAAVEPAPAKAGEDAGEGRQGDDEIARISLGEHSRKSFRVNAGVFAVVGPEYRSDTPERGIHRALPGQRRLRQWFDVPIGLGTGRRAALRSDRAVRVQFRVPRWSVLHQMALWDVARSARLEAAAAASVLAVAIGIRV